MLEGIVTRPLLFTWSLVMSAYGPTKAHALVELDRTLEQGILAEYFVIPPGLSSLSQIDFEAAPIGTEVVGALDHATGRKAFWTDGPTDYFAARYTGALQVETAGRYTLYLTSDDGSALYLNGQRIIDNDGRHRTTTREVTLDLEAGAHALEVLYFEHAGEQTLQLEWQGPDSGEARRIIDGAALAHITEAAPSEDVLPEPVDDIAVPDGPVLEIEPGVVATVDGGRVTTLVSTEPDILTLRLMDQPLHGHASVNPDNSIALVLTGSDYEGQLDLWYEITDRSGTITAHRVALDVTPSAQKAGWGTSANHYMLATDSDGHVVVEHGEAHRKVFVSQDGLTARDIAAIEGVPESVVTTRWLRTTRPEYGASEATALNPDLGFRMWYEINPIGSTASNWLLLERGHEYDAGRVFPRGASGESPLHPLFIGAWGDGAAPKITSVAYLFQNLSQNIVVQGVEFSNGLMATQLRNVLFDNVIFSGNEAVFNSRSLTEGLTIRNSIVRDVWITVPVDKDGDGVWDPFDARKSGIYVENVDGVLLDKTIVDHNGWAPDFAADGSTAGGHPPSMYSHNIYMQHNTRDVTMRDSIIMRGASFGAQFRGGAHVEDNLFLDNNIAFSTLGGDYRRVGPVGEYSLILGNVVTAAANRGASAPEIGALDWGIRNSGLLTSLKGNIVTHANDPDDPGNTAPGASALDNAKGAGGVFSDDTIIWRWGSTDTNADGLDPNTLNETTIQRYTANLLGTETATIDDLAHYLRALEPTDYAAATADILDWFRAGFAMEDARRVTPETVRFLPDAHADGVRWDNRLNWSTNELPGAVDGDSVDLGGNRVVFGGDVMVVDMRFGVDGGLTVNHGRLTVSGVLTSDVGATLDIDRAGQFWTDGATGTETLRLGVAGGRFVNTGLFDAPVMLSATGGQTILATGGGEFRVDAQGHVDITGATTRIGFDGNDDGTAILRFEAGATLRFISSEGKLGVLEEFRSGAFGPAPSVQSGVDLGGATLELDLSQLIAGDTLVLVEVDELNGSFDDVRVWGLGNRDAAVIVDYDADTVSLHLAEGTGRISVSHEGTPDMVEPGHLALWELLDGQSSVTDTPDL